MRSKFLSVLMLLFLSIGVCAQTTINGSVVAIIPMGNQAFSILNETGTENYFKTSPHPLGELQLQASIQIELHPNDKIGRVISPTLSEPLFCRRIQPNTPLDQLVAVLQYMPQEENDILFFEDTTHIRLFYDEIVELYEMTEKELDLILDAVESQFIGYRSFRTHFNQENNWLTGSFTLEEIERIAMKDFVSDEILKTFLNAERFVGVGDSIFYWHAENIQIAIHKDYSRGILTLANLPEDYDPYGVGSFALKDSAIRLISPLYTGGTSPKGQAIVTDSLYYESDPITKTALCDAQTKILRLEVLEYFTKPSGIIEIDTHYHSATLSIDWDDNSPIQVITNYSGQEISHYYNDLGDYFPTTTIVFNDRYGDQQTLEDGNSTDGKDITFKVQTACTNADAAQYFPTVSPDGEWLMGSKIWINNNFIASSVGSYTHSWKKNNDGVWERHKSDIYAKVYGQFRDTDCVHNETKEKSDLQHLQKKNQVTRHKIRHHWGFANGDVTSHHYMVKGSLFLVKDLVLNPC